MPVAPHLPLRALSLLGAGALAVGLLVPVAAPAGQSRRSAHAAKHRRAAREQCVLKRAKRSSGHPRNFRLCTKANDVKRGRSGAGRTPQTPTTTTSPEVSSLYPAVEASPSTEGAPAGSGSPPSSTSPAPPESGNAPEVGANLPPVEVGANLPPLESSSNPSLPRTAQEESFAGQPSDVLLTYSQAVSPSVAAGCIGYNASGGSEGFDGIEQGPTSETIRLQLIPGGQAPVEIECHVGGEGEAASIKPSALEAAVAPATKGSGDVEVLAVSPGAQSAAAFPAGSVVAWGENNHGQLGGGFRGGKVGALRVAALGVSGVTGVAAGYNSTLVLLGDGTVRSWGGNLFGQLGDGSRADSLTPTNVSGLADVTAISVSGAQDMALLSDGTVVAWGSDQYGTLGDGLTGLGHPSLVPVAVRGVADAVAVAHGHYDAAALLANGTVMAWGTDQYGQLGVSPRSGAQLPTLVPGLSEVKAIAVGDGDLYALLQNGTVEGIGLNDSGQLGDGSTANSSVPVHVKGLANVAAISASSGYSDQVLALLENGSVETWGGNDRGQLGVGSQTGPEICGGGSRVNWCSKTPLPVKGLADVSAISAGYSFDLAVSNGTIFSWGWNYYGELGDGTRVESDVPVEVKLSGVAGVAAGLESSVAYMG